MLTQIKTFKGNALALEITENFTETDAQLIEKLFEEKISQGFAHVNILIKVKDMSIMKNMEIKGFLKGEFWGMTHFGKLGRCAVVTHSDFIETVVKIENKVLSLFNSAFEEKYFDTTQLDEALKYISPEE
ncbi:STAS/SEC14 domain-containing protein [Flavobacterium sp.]|uniref:STAS/SEC14 domain-containing protein n=1 Tax=Flavobacterium sp. TaxID=239 RepID=UPI002C80DE4E|nr:STAS/SEC14 domain-containing protein [Flavobacterium sp.]HSD07695.1 STAS/SEC14 domain-containing protein [Flavobacterium sp.]